MARSRASGALALAGLLALLAAPAAAELPATLGRLELAALWATGGAASPLSVGVGMWAANAGQAVGRLLDPHDGVDLGAVGGADFATYGGGLVADFHPGPARRLEGVAARTGPFFHGNAGAYAVQIALRGHLLRSQGTVGWSAGLGWRFQLGRRVTVGPAIHYTRVFDDELGRYVAAGLDWVWR